MFTIATSDRRTNCVVHCARCTFACLHNSLHKRIKNVQCRLASGHNCIACTLDKDTQWAGNATGQSELSASMTTAAAECVLTTALTLLAAVFTAIFAMFTSVDHLLLLETHFNSSATHGSPRIPRSCLNNARESSGRSGKYPKLSLLSRTTSR